MSGDYVRTPTLVVALSLAGRPALVVGGGPEAVMKTRKLLDAGARVTLVTPELTASLRELALARRLTWFVRDLHDSDLLGQHVVVLCDRDPGRAAALRASRTRYGYLLATVDQPSTCDFFFTAKVEAGPVELSLSSGGTTPLLLRRMREQLQAAFDKRFQDFADSIASLRASLAGRPAGQRRARLAAALDGFAIEVRLRYPEPRGQASGQGKGHRA